MTLCGIVPIYKGATSIWEKRRWFRRFLFLTISSIVSTDKINPSANFIENQQLEFIAKFILDCPNPTGSGYTVIYGYFKYRAEFYPARASCTVHIQIILSKTVQYTKLTGPL